MRRLCLTFVLLAVLAFASSAAATSPSTIAAKTKAVFNRKMAFAGYPSRIASVRCLAETPTDWYCIGQLTHGPVASLAWDVTLTKGNVLSWSLAG